MLADLQVCLDYWNVFVLELFEAHNQMEPAASVNMMGLQVFLYEFFYMNSMALIYIHLCNSCTFCKLFLLFHLLFLVLKCCTLLLHRRLIAHMNNL